MVVRPSRELASATLARALVLVPIASICAPAAYQPMEHRIVTSSILSPKMPPTSAMMMGACASQRSHRAAPGRRSTCCSCVTTGLMWLLERARSSLLAPHMAKAQRAERERRARHTAGTQENMRATQMKPPTMHPVVSSSDSGSQMGLVKERESRRLEEPMQMRSSIASCCARKASATHRVTSLRCLSSARPLPCSACCRAFLARWVRCHAQTIAKHSGHKCNADGRCATGRQQVHQGGCAGQVARQLQSVGTL